MPPRGRWFEIVLVSSSTAPLICLHRSMYSKRADQPQMPWESQQPKRGRLWLADGSCIRLRPQQRNHVWSYDFVEDRTHDGRKYRMLNVLDEFSHECLAVRVARRLNDRCDRRSVRAVHPAGHPAHIRSDNGPEFVAKAVQEWIAVVGAKTAYIVSGPLITRL